MGGCEVHQVCAMSRPQMEAVFEAVKTNEVIAIKNILATNPKAVRFSAKRQAIQLLDCAGIVRAQIQVSDDVLAALR